jgi:hypothetical protein
MSSGCHFQNNRHNTAQIQHCPISMTLMLNLCSIVVAILKMATGRNFSMSGMNSAHHYLPTCQILMISDNVEFLPSIFLCRVLVFLSLAHEQISGTTGQNFMKLGGVIDICF